MITINKKSLHLICISLTAVVGCGSERLKPEDFKRRERSEVIVQSPPQTQSQEGAAQARPTPSEPSAATPEDLLREAARSGNLAGVKAQADTGVSVDASDPQGRTALQLAAFDGHVDTVAWLIAEKADVNHRDELGRTALMYASTGDNLSTVEALLAAGAEVNLVDQAERFTALMFAAAEGQNAIVSRLMESQADPSMADADGETALNFAQTNGHASVVELLSPAKP